jgi:hypothetical protein
MHGICNTDVGRVKQVRAMMECYDLHCTRSYASIIQAAASLFMTMT